MRRNLDKRLWRAGEITADTSKRYGKHRNAGGQDTPLS